MTLCVAVIARCFAYTLQHPSTLTLLARIAFVPVVLAIAFLTDDSIHDLHAALPAPPWLVVAGRVLLTLPLIALTTALQFVLGAATLTVIENRVGRDAVGHSVTMSLVLPSFIAELAAWLAITLAVAGVVERTRWNDLAGPIAALTALAIIGLLALTPLPLFPADPTTMSSANHEAWLTSDEIWCAVGLAAVLIIRHASRDPWLRLRSRPALRHAR